MYNCFLKKGADVLFRRKQGGRCTIIFLAGGAMYNYFLRRGGDVQFWLKRGGGSESVRRGADLQKCKKGGQCKIRVSKGGLIYHLLLKEGGGSATEGAHL